VVCCRWFIYGKHPDFADYLRIGEDTQFTAAYTKWVSRGFQKYIDDKGICEQVCSYRFWSRGDSETTLAAGLLWSSRDSLGRPFPLLFMGITSLSGWQDCWPDLDGQLMPIWERIEEMAAGKLGSPKDLFTSLHHISLPVASGNKRRQACSETPPNAVFIGGCKGEISRQIRFTHPLTKQDFVRLMAPKIP
jgi:type VI secretion system ImpM family protein